MKVVLIPGMDGTGFLFAPFIEVAPAGIEVISLPLLQRADADYDDQAKHIIASIGEEPIVLVAESYSGMVAYSMLKMGLPNIRHIVFAASFLGRPSALALWARHIPVALLKSNIVPKFILSKLLFGHFRKEKLVSLFDKALHAVSSETLSFRLNQIAMLPNPSIPIDIPCTYIRPTGDNLVSNRAIKVFQRLCRNLEIKEVDGTHFVLQTNPEMCWLVIQDVIESQKTTSHL